MKRLKRSGGCDGLVENDALATRQFFGMLITTAGKNVSAIAKRVRKINSMFVVKILAHFTLF